MSLANRIAQNTAIQIAGKVLSTALGIGIVAILTRELGREGFGAYSTANAFLQVFTLVLDLGLNVTLVALLGEHAGNEKYERRCTSALFTLRIFMAGVTLLLLAPLIGLATSYSWEIKLAIVALTGSFFFPSLNQVVMGAQQRHLRMTSAAIAENIGRIVALGGLIVGIWLGWGLLPSMWIITLASAFTFLYNFFSVRRYVDFSWNWDVAFWKSALSRSWPVGLSVAFGLIYFKADTLILSWVRPQAEVGVYGAAYRVLEILIAVPFIYAGLILPILSKAWATKDKAAFGTIMARSVDLMSLLVAPLIAGTWLVGPNLMQAISGSEFRVSGNVLGILILAIGVIFFNTVFSHAVVAQDLQKRMIPIYILTAVFTLTGYLLFIPTYGIWAAAWLTVFSETCVGLGSLIVTGNALRIPFKISLTLKAIIGAVAMYIVVLPLKDLWLPIPILVGALVYSALLFLTGALNKKMIQELVSLREKKVDTSVLP